MAIFEFRIITEDLGVSEDEMIAQGFAAIWCAININILHFNKHPEDICALGQGKIKYDSDNKDVLLMISEISTAPVLIERGVGLCIDIVAFDVAAKICEGCKVWPHIFSRGGGIFHVVTQGYDSEMNVIEYDPSEELESMGLVKTFQPKRCGLSE